MQGMSFSPLQRHFKNKKVKETNIFITRNSQINRRQKNFKKKWKFKQKSKGIQEPHKGDQKEDQTRQEAIYQ